MGRGEAVTHTCGGSRDDLITAHKNSSGLRFRVWVGKSKMSDLGTRIIAAGLVDDGIAVEAIEKSLADLTAAVASGSPVCPVCKCAMKQQNYQGYYDSFSYWGCDCVEFPGASTWSGVYA